MAKKENKHTIEHQIINLEVSGTDDEKEINQLQQNLLYFYKERIGKVLNDTFDKLAPPDVHIQIDELVLDLGSINYKEPADIERAITRKVKKLVEKEVRKKMDQMRSQRGTNRGHKQKFSKMELLEFFLQKGYYPPWASPENGSMSAIFDDLTSRNTKYFVQRIFQLRKNPKVRERLFQQFSVEQLQLLFELIYKNNTTLANKQIQVLNKQLGKQSEKAIISAAINYALDGSSALGTIQYDERIFTQRIIEEVQNRKLPSTKKTKVRAGFEGQHKDIQIIEYFLKHGAIPDWADVDSKKSLQELFDTLLEHQLVPMQRMLERFIDQPNFIRRLIFQFSTDQVLQLLTPTPNENIQFILNSIKDFEFLTTTRQNIRKTISTSKVRELVLSQVLTYFFLDKKTKFVRKTFIKSVLESFSEATQTDYTVLVKESYKNVRRKKKETAIRSALEDLDKNLRNKLDKERKELRIARKEYQQLNKSLEKFLDKQSKGNLSETDSKELNNLRKKMKQLEKNMEELEDLDMPLEIEILLKQRTALKNQLKVASQQEKAKLESRLNNTEKEFLKLQNVLNKEVELLLTNKKKLHTEVHNIAKYKINQLNNRMRRHHRAINNVLQQLSLDKKDLELFLADINRSLRGKISSEEKQQLRSQRTALQKEFVQLEQHIKGLTLQQQQLEETLDSTLYAVDHPNEDLVEKTGTSKLDALIFMLKYGSTPWWAEDLPRQSIEELFLEFADQNPTQLQRTLQNVGKYPVVWERIINQLSGTAIKTVLEKLFPSNIKKIVDHADLLFTLHYSQGFEKLKNIDSKKFQWAVIVEYLLSHKKTFNAQDFNKEVTLQTARLYNLSPTKLLKYTNNIIKNNEQEESDLFVWNQNLIEDKKVAALEREQIIQQQEQQLKEEGIYLNNGQKLELLAEFISTGRITKRAEEFKYDLQEKFETLLLEQIQNNKRDTLYVVFNLLRLSNARHLIINTFPEELFWEIIYLVRPKALLPVQRHFDDFKRVFGDDKLGLEKDVLLNHLLAQQQVNFDPLDYVKAVLLAKHQATGRKPLAILSEWKRKIKALNSPRSSWLVSTLMLEVDALKLEQRNATDMELQANLNEQINTVAKEYTDSSTQLIDVLTEETAEAQGIPEKAYKLSELHQLIQKHQTDLALLQKELAEADAFQVLEKKRKIAQHQAQLKLLQQLRPPLLRKVERQIDDLRKALEKAEESVKKQDEKTQLETLLEEKESFEASLIERQVEILELLQKETPDALSLLPQLLDDLEDDMQSHLFFFQDLENTAKNIQSTLYRTTLIQLLENAKPSVISLDELKKSADLGQQQKDLLKDIGQVAPIILWKKWDELETYYQQNPKQLTAQRKGLQEEIRKAIQRKDQQNLRSYGALLRVAQNKLEQQLEQATTLEVLKDLEEEIEVLWQQQQFQVDEMLEVARDEKTRRDFKRLRKNIDVIFTRLKNDRIQRSNKIAKDTLKVLEEEEAEKVMKLKELEQQKEFIIEDIERQETPVVVEKEKKKRTPKAPVPEAIVEPLQIYNAGMVLLWPFVTRLFQMLGYVKDKQFVDEEAQYKGIHILQYLVTGKTEAPENELVLNKILCNFPVTNPVPFRVEFSPNELQAAESLLGGVIKNWSKMKNMTPNSLRGSFLIRNGAIKEEEDKWNLQVERQTFDILLKSVPWGFSFIKFSWLEKFLTVEWKLM